MRTSLLSLFSLFLLFSTNLNSQTRIACLPFQNMDGLITLNLLSYQLQDSVVISLREIDPEEKYYRIVPKDSIEQLLAEFNLDPTSPQYPSDLWKAVSKLNVERVIMGNFNVQAERILINAYVYNVKTKMPLPTHQARDIFKSEQNVMQAVPVIIKRILPAIKPL